MDSDNKICVGIDFGSHSIYICVANCEVPENALSSMQTMLNCLQTNRRITPMVGLNNDQILSCDAGNYSRKKNPCGFVPFLKQYLYPYNEYEQNKYDFANHSEIVSGKNGYNAFKITTNNNKQYELSSDLILSAVFQDLKALICKTYPSFQGKNTVVSIPVTWPSEKIAMLLRAMAVAGFQDVSFVYDIEAITMEIGYYENHYGRLVDHKALFVEIGYTHLNVFTCAYKQGEPFNIEFCCNSTRYGAKTIDEALTQYVVETITKKYNLPESVLLSNPRDKLTIWNTCAQEKFMFSSNTVKSITFSFSLLCMHEEDISIELTYSQFKELCKRIRIIDTFMNMLARCLQASGEVHTVLFEGSMARLCIFEECIKEVLSKTPYKPQFLHNNNVEEDVCRGCCKFSCIRSGVLRETKVILPKQIDSLGAVTIKPLTDMLLDIQPDPDVQKMLCQMRDREKDMQINNSFLDKIERLRIEIFQMLLSESPEFSFDNKVKEETREYLTVFKKYLSENIEKQLKKILMELKKMKENKFCGIGLSFMM